MTWDLTSWRISSFENWIMHRFSVLPEEDSSEEDSSPDYDESLEMQRDEVCVNAITLTIWSIFFSHDHLPHFFWNVTCRWSSCL